MCIYKSIFIYNIRLAEKNNKLHVYLNIDLKSNKIIIQHIIYNIITVYIYISNYKLYKYRLINSYK